MMNHQDIHDRLPDYVLGLLSPLEEGQIAGHLAVCASCRQIVQQERQIGLLVAETLNVTARTDAARLRRVMPAPPAQQRRRPALPRWSRQWAPVTAVLMLLLFTILLQAPQTRRALPALLPITSTATMTNTPTATLAQGLDLTIELTPKPLTTSVRAASVQPAIATPTAPATPLAAHSSARSE
jgi:anti-sigma factor RsiW